METDTFEPALEAFNALSDYKDSNEKAAECEMQIEFKEKEQGI